MNKEELEYEQFCNEKLREKITNLEYKIKRLEEENRHIFANVNDDQLLRSNAMTWAELQDYKSRIDKAIEYIEENCENYAGLEEYKVKDLLNILKGGNE